MKLHDNNLNENNRSFSISTFLSQEIEFRDICLSPKYKKETAPKKEGNDNNSNNAQERIYNFFWLFFRLEKILFFGFWICFDSFLMIITILPTRIIYRIYKNYKYRDRDYLDLIRILTLILCVYILTSINLSQIYHFIRGQENFKLYVLFKIIVIIEHLLSSFGEDCNESLFKSITIINLLIYIFYNILHSILLYGHLITLNAAMNSPNNTLITILVADNFYELKSNIFKKYQIENLFQMLCNDIVERFTIFIFVLLILIQNLCYLGFDNNFDAQIWFIDSFKLFLIMIGFEIIIDTIKHGFICKFNNLSINIYKSFYIRLSIDITNTRRINTNNDTYFINKRLGFSSLPLVSLFLRVLWQINEYNSFSIEFKLLFIIILFIIIYCLKLLLSLCLIIKSISKLTNNNDYKQYLIATNKLSNVTRYALIVKKIPI